MVRSILSLVVAAVTTVGGLWLAFAASGMRSRALATFQLEAAILPSALLILAALLLAVAALAAAIHWLGVLVVGVVQLVLGALALVPPIGGTSPLLTLTDLLRGASADVAFGGLAFGLTGAQLALGIFLVVAALATRARVRSRRSRSSRAVSAVLAVVGGVAILGSVALIWVQGDQLAQAFMRMFRYDAGLVAAVVAAALLAAVGGASLRWSPFGVLVAGAIVLIAGLILLFAWASLPAAVLGSTGSAYGLVLVLGASFVGSGVAAAIRRPAAASAV